MQFSHFMPVLPGDKFDGKRPRAHFALASGCVDISGLAQLRFGPHPCGASLYRKGRGTASLRERDFKTVSLAPVFLPFSLRDAQGVGRAD